MGRNPNIVVPLHPLKQLQTRNAGREGEGKNSVKYIARKTVDTFYFFCLFFVSFFSNIFFKPSSIAKVAAASAACLAKGFRNSTIGLIGIGIVHYFFNGFTIIRSCIIKHLPSVVLLILPKIYFNYRSKLVDMFFLVHGIHVCAYQLGMNIYGEIP